MRVAIVLGAAALLLYGPAGADYSQRDDVRTYMDELVSEHGFDRAELTATFRDARHQPRIVEAISRPAERALKWYEYRRIFIQDSRIDQGVAFWTENEASLRSAEESFAVAPEYVVAIIGVETRFGRIMGSHRVLDALSTLAFDYPPRADFFRNELTEFLLLAREEGRSVGAMKGSYAGAMGYGQFIPSSYRNYAVDFDNDGLRDIWANKADAIGSVANYFAEHGWRPAQDVALRVDVADAEQADAAVLRGLDLNKTVGELRALGVEAPGLKAAEAAALLRMELEDGAEYWMALHNFHVITRYNRSQMYALAVHQLSQAIKARRQARLAAATEPALDAVAAAPRNPASPRAR